MFTEQDLTHFKQRGIAIEAIEEQIKKFKHGFPYLPLSRAATINDGIKKIGEKEANELITIFERKKEQFTIVKFVPASGAATRMFKALFSFLGNYKGTKQDFAAYTADKGFQSVYSFFNNLNKFAFYDDLKQAYKKIHTTDLEQALKEHAFTSILQVLLGKEGLDYGALPKGLLKFHAYEDGKMRTPVEEHMVEAAEYGKDKNGKAKIHFTVSPEHRERFQTLINNIKEAYEKVYSTRFDISFSEQKASTDTIAVNLENKPFKEKDGTILFRPAGHGALIYNLNEIDTDLIFIKNIDNIVPDKIKTETIRYKKILAGLLLKYQEKIFEYIKKLHQENAHTYLEEISTFLQKQLGVEPINSNAKQKEYLLNKLNRPIRVCGMVKNEGEPGGGPFWAKNTDGTISLQIVESAQVDIDNPAQKEIFDNATHFNPVDLVCGVKNYKGEKFNLEKYSDPTTGFISKKSKDGRDLKAQELPGLWNGSMADWNTVFVEVPIITFNPVKTVNDLLRPEHQK